MNGEYKIGEKFDFNGVTLQVVEDNKDCNGSYCKGCYFDNAGKDYCKKPISFKCECSYYMRNDDTNVIFKQV